MSLNFEISSLLFAAQSTRQDEVRHLDRLPALRLSKAPDSVNIFEVATALEAPLRRVAHEHMHLGPIMRRIDLGSLFKNV